MRFFARLALLCSALLLTLALAPRPLAAQSGAIGVRGDVNGDGVVTAVDALALLSHVVGKPLPGAFTVELDGDADGSGEVTAMDALVILGHAVGKDVARYPVGQRLLSGRVSPAGGTLASRLDSIRLDLPEGALPAATTVTVRPAEGLSGAAGTLAGTALAVGPEEASFARPVRLTLRVSPAALPAGAAPEGLRIHRRVGDGWEEVPGGSVDAAAGTVTAELGGGGTFAVRMAGAPAAGRALVRESGDGQTGVVGRPPLAFLVARLVNPAGRGVAGVELAWTVTEGGGSVRPLQARTDSAGRVRAVLTLGAAPGTNRVRVSAPGADSVVFTAQGVADAPSGVTVVAGADQTATAGSAVATPPAVRVTDSAGNPVVDVAVTFAAATGGGSVVGGATRTDANGVATVGSWTLGTAAGPNTLVATVQGGPAATVAATGLPGAAASISVRAGDGGTAVVATTRALEAKVVDAHGNGVPGVAVSWAVASGGGSLSAAGSTTDGSGVASVVWTFGGATGAQSATASATGLAGSPLTFAASTTPAAATQLTLATQPSGTARSGIALAAQPVVQLRDAFGNAAPQAGVAVTAAIATGGGTLGGTATASTDAAGVATFTDLAISGTVGQRTLSFSATGLTGVASGAVDVAAGTAASLAASAGDGQTAVAGSAVATAPSVRVTDASGNPVPGVSVAFAVASGGGSVTGATAASDASGIAAVGSWTLGTTAGANTLTASATGLTPVTFSATGTAGAAAAISVRSGDGGSAQVGTTRVLEARVVDANGNPVQAHAVAWAVATGGGSLSAPSSATDAAGVATVTWTFGITAGAQSATASSAGLAGSPLAFTAATTPAPASRLAVATQPSSSARSGIVFATQPAVQLQDAFGNAVAQGGVAVTAAVAGGTLGGTAVVSTDGAGLATFAGLSISGTTGAYTLGFSAAGLTDAASVAVSLAPGNPAALVVATQPSSTARSGIAFAAQPSVQLQDASGNAVGQAGVAVTVSIASGGGTLGGAASAATDAGGRATFAGLSISGTAGQRTLAFAGAGLSGAASAPVELLPGAPASLSVTTQPSSAAQSGAAFPAQPVLQLRDADGNAVPQAGVSVTASIATGGGALGGTTTVSTDAAGQAVFTDLAISGTVGDRTLGFSAGALTGAPSGTITVSAGAAASLAANAGDGQSAVAGSAVATAPSVVVRDASGNPVSGVSVTFAVATGGGSVVGASATTDASGIAAAGSWTLGTTAGANTLAASAGSLTPATFTATATAGAATQIVVTTQPSTTAQSGIALGAQPVLQLRDAYGNDVAQSGVAVTAAIASGGGALGGTATVATNAAGQAVFTDLAISGTVGDRALSFSAGSLAGAPSNTVSLTAGAATQLAITTQPSPAVQSGAALGTQPVVQLRDASGNDVAQAGVSVTAAIASGGGALGGTTTVATNAAGQAVFTDLAISGTVGDRTLSFSAGALTGAPSGTITVSAGAAASLAINAGNGQTATAGSAVAAAPSVVVRDASGNPVSGVSVSFAVATGGGSVTGATATTDVSGIASVGSWTLGTTAGANSLSGSASGLAPATFSATATAGAATQLVIATQPSTTAQSGIALGTQPVLQLRDAFGNDVAQAGASVTAAIASGGGVLGGTATVATNASGRAVFAGLSISGTLGDRTLGFSAVGLTGATSNTISVTAGSATQLAITTQPSATVQSGAALGTQPVVQLRDASGNDVAQAGVSVTASIASGGGVLGGTATAATNAAGQAVFSDLAISGTVGDRTLSFSAGALTGAPSGTITVSAGAAASLAVDAGSGQSAVVGSAVSTAPAVVVRDASGNPVSGVSVTFAVATGGGSVTGATATSDASGIATAGSWTLGTTAGANTLSASAGSLTPATFTATGTAGAATRIVVTTQPSGTAQSGIAFGAQPALQLRDTYGNDVAQPGVGVTAAIASGGGVLGGTATAATNGAGRAVFSSLSISGTIGDRTLSFSAGGLTGATSDTIRVTAGAASQIFVTRQPASTVQNGSILGVAPVLQLRDASGNDVAQASVPITVAIASGGGVLSGGTTASTDAGGQAVPSGLVITGTAGDHTLSFSSAGLTGATSGAITVTPGPATSLGISAGDGQTAVAGSAVSTAPSVVVRDVSNNPVAGVSVTFAAATGGGSVTGATGTTGASGIAAVGSWTLGTTAGANTLTASSAGLTGATFTATGVAGAAAAISIQSGDGGTATVASTRVLEARVVDANGNPVQGHTVNWAAATGGGSVSVPASTTSAAGVASTTWTLGTAAGAQTATATSTGLGGSPLTFTAATTAAAAAAGSSTLAASPTSITADGTSTSTLTVQLRDQYGNNLGSGGGTVALSATAGTLSAVTDNGNGTYTATLTAPTTTGSATVSGTLNGGALASTAAVAFVPGAAARYVVAASAATATAGGTVTVTAQLVDANGNAVPAAGRTVTWSSTNGGSFASPTSATDAAGVATTVFTTSTTSGTTHAVTADDGTVNGTSGNVVTQVGAAATIVKSGADGVSLAAGSAVTPLPSVRVVDANGNGVAGVGVTFAVTAGGGAVTDGTRTTDATGAAVVGSWTLGTTAGVNTLGVTAGSLNAAFTVTGTVGPASAAGTQITTANAALTSGSITTVTVQARDQHGNAVTAGGATVALSTDLGTLGPVTDVGNGTYTADLVHAGTNGTATVTGTLNGTPITDNAVVSFQAGGILRTWTGLAGSAWSTAGSWSPRGTPTTSDTIVINGGGTQPQVTDADKTILRLVMTSAGGTLDLNGFRLTISGDAVASGGVVSDGTVVMSGSARTIQGTFPNLLVTGGAAAGGSTTAKGVVTVTSGTLTITNQTLTIQGQ